MTDHRPGVHHVLDAIDNVLAWDPDMPDAMTWSPKAPDPTTAPGADVGELAWYGPVQTSSNVTEDEERRFRSWLGERFEHLDLENWQIGLLAQLHHQAELIRHDGPRGRRSREGGHPELTVLDETFVLVTPPDRGPECPR